MANEIQIRVTGRNDATGTMEQVRQQMRSLRSDTAAAAEAERALARAEAEQGAAARRSGESTRRHADETRRMGQAAQDADREQRRMGEGSDHNTSMFGRLSAAAVKAGEAFTSLGQRGVESAVEMTGRGGPYAALAEIAAILTVLPVAAQAAGAGIVLGVGGGLAGLGIKVATMRPQVQAEFKGMVADVKAELQDMTEGSFEPQMMRISAIAKGTFDRLAPSLRAAFGRMAPEVGDFAQHAGDALAKLEPMIDRLSVAFGPMLKVLGERLPDIAEHVGDALAKIGEKADPKSLDMLIDAIDGTIVVLREAIVFLEDFGNKISWVYDKIKVGADAIGSLFKGAGDAKTLGTALADVGTSALDAASSIADLKRQMEQLANQNLTAREAARGFEEAIDAAGEAAKKNGKTLDINSQKGRANQEALDSIASSALAMRDAMDKSGQDSSAAMERARKKFIDTAMSMGQSRKAAERLADRLGLVRDAANHIPKSKQLTIKDNANARRQAMNILAGTIRGLPNKTVTVNIRTLGAAALNSARNLLNSIPGAAGGGYAHGGIVGAAATGGPRSGMVLVGEQGPELVKLAPGSTVIPNGQTSSMLEDKYGWGREHVSSPWTRRHTGDEWSRQHTGNEWSRRHQPPTWDRRSVDPWQRKQTTRGTPRSSAPGGGYAGGDSGGNWNGVLKVELEWVGTTGSEELFQWLRKNIRIRGGNVQTVLGS